MLKRVGEFSSSAEKATQEGVIRGSPWRLSYVRNFKWGKSPCCVLKLWAPPLMGISLGYFVKRGKLCGLPFSWKVSRSSN